jgi:hypothetical protein
MFSQETQVIHLRKPKSGSALNPSVKPQPVSDRENKSHNRAVDSRIPIIKLAVRSPYIYENQSPNDDEYQVKSINTNPEHAQALTELQIRIDELENENHRLYDEIKELRSVNIELLRCCQSLRLSQFSKCS